MKRLLVVICLLFSVSAFAQKADRPLVQFTGVIYNADSAKITVPYVTITNESFGKTATVANYKGYFSFVAHEQDTLRFTSVGYDAKIIVIPKNVNKNYTVQVFLKPDIINLPTFKVFPWATTDEFRKDFISMKLADDDLEVARKNLSKGSLSEMSKTLARSADEIQSATAQSMHTSILNSHSLTPNPLLNPVAWGTLINQITAGDKSRQSGN